MGYLSAISTLLLGSFALSVFAYLDAGPHADPRLSIRPEQSVGVTASLTCFGKPIPNVLVKLYNKAAIRDDWLAEGHTNDQGQISLRGRKNQFSVISPHFNIYHDCNDSDHICQRKFRIEIPKSAVSMNEIETKPNFDAGTIELSGPYPRETRDCIH